MLGGLTGCIHTEPFRDHDGHILPGSVATMEMVPIGGTPQSLWIRGVDAGNPALILLHGGPGTSESALFRHYDALLEAHFLVVSLFSGLLGAAGRGTFLSWRPSTTVYDRITPGPGS
jgi:hypothetical protein